MRLERHDRVHLTYCTNIHVGETWPEVRSSLEKYVRTVKAIVCPERAFGVGLRLSAVAAAALEEGRELDALRDWLAGAGLYVFTINGFPYGVFHGTRVKEGVYLPDWLDEERVTYTARLARLLARLLPEGVNGSVSTVPAAFRARIPNDDAERRIATNLLRCALSSFRLFEETGKHVELSLEPEPCCHLETISEAISFFERRLLTAEALSALARDSGLSRARSEDAVRRYLGICLDACHVAVQFEDPVDAVAQLRRAGIRVGKVQVTAGLEASLTGSVTEDRETLDALGRFADETYLHQVVESRSGAFLRYVDLPEALSAFERNPAPGVWRVHFHVPIFREALGRFRSTQPFVRRLLELTSAEPISDHLEVETYTWDVLPPEHRHSSVVDAIAGELRWALERLA